MLAAATQSRRPLPKRPCASIRLARAARVLRRFDLPMLKLSAGVTSDRVARAFIAASLAAGSIAGPPIARRRQIDGCEWTFIPKGTAQ